MNFEINLLLKKVQLYTQKYTCSLIILKGFSLNTIHFLRDKYLFIESGSYFDKQGRFRLQVVEQNLEDLESKIQEPKGNTLILYETFFFLQEKVQIINCLKFPLVLIENNLLEYYPSIAAEKGVDYKTAEEDILTANHDKIEALFYTFYSDCQEYEGQQWVQYFTLDEEVLNAVEYCPLIDLPSEVEKKSFAKVIQRVDSLPVGALPLTLNGLEWDGLKKVVLESSAYFSAEYVIVDDLEELRKQGKIEGLYLFIQFLNKIGCNARYYQSSIRVERCVPNQKLFELLRKYWNSNSFRELEFYESPSTSLNLVRISQGEIVQNIIEQYETCQHIGAYARDIFITAPTGAGKSLLFQLPAIYLGQKYQKVTIVVSPLIALMKDQVNSLRQRGYSAAVCLNSELSYLERIGEIEKIKKGEYHIVYLSPELLLSYDITYFLEKREIGLLVVDEAHLVTTWGRDFRVDYWYLGNYIHKIRKYYNHRFVLVALTATAIYNPGGYNDMVFETIDSLQMNIPILYLGKVRRDNIVFEVNNIQLKKPQEEKLERTTQRIKEFIEERKKAIVYCPWVSQMSDIYDKLSPEYKVQVSRYHGSLYKDEKEEGYFAFKYNETKVMIATKAFGMGVDIPDIEFVYHHAPSGSFADYVQEVGRLARNPEIQGKALIDFHESDLQYTRILYGLSSIKQHQLRMMIEKLLRLYKQNKSSNLLVTVENFDHIFDDVNGSLEQKVKSALMLLEKDLLRRYKHVVLIARPKSLFTIAYIRIDGRCEAKFNERYGQFLEKLNQRKYNNKSYGYYTIDLMKLWEARFKAMSFPQLKRLFFSGKLLHSASQEDEKGLFYVPLLRVQISLHKQPASALESIKSNFSKIENALYTLEAQDKYFSKEALVEALKKELVGKKVYFLERLADLLIHLYSCSSYNYYKNRFRFSKEYFLISRQNQGQKSKSVTYKIANQGYRWLKSNLEKTFIDTFKCKDKDEFTNQISRFIPYNEIRQQNYSSKKIIQLAYIIEFFNLGTYEIQGGELPAIFIKISSPTKLEEVINDNYENSILDAINKRHEEAMLTMQKFFTTPYSNTERWDFIENYFLGREIKAS
ncbi:MAG: DEAD/DEAH box helicase [Bacteroidia bacterium]|nr:DEAD/DEAH box helicase [Bacteroidia bacterium]MDW8159200.1 DEAD/DEAH box helicase [Bacteroidia bacterium]